MVRLLREGGADTVLAVRRHAGNGAAQYRPGHQWGNAVFSATFSGLFATRYSDVLTGYRGFSRRFVKSCPLLARGFDVEIELNAHSASLGLPFAEVDAAYQERPAGSASKLNTYRDGARILRRLLRLHRDFRPFASFGVPGLLALTASAAMFTSVLLDFMRTGLVERFPTLFVSVGAGLAGLVLLLVGTVLERASRDRIERNRLAYLAASASTGWSAPLVIDVEGRVPAATVRDAPARGTR